MRKSTLLRLGVISYLAIMSWCAEAVVINGAHYLRYLGNKPVCPNGTKVYIYKGVRYCRVFRANISWRIPTTRTNGKPLLPNEIKKYEIYWIRPSDNASGTISIASGTQTSMVFQVNKSGTYYFAMSAIDAASRKSPLSGLVKANINK